eukprot:gnl/Spiro4/8602_TR4507_c0_g1_i1.p1 gnl/Spiro4/8602_TR4507_c0_g1~~gnl/Spiro4/8602_TR4507_c0_g1_i1.p1  ORF type:complete len:319 (-),score=56.53 gnl/Spiro4/8602_TR4507_c0_g1_i1:216-1142(-)
MTVAGTAISLFLVTVLVCLPATVALANYKAHVKYWAGTGMFCDHTNTAPTRDVVAPLGDCVDVHAGSISVTCAKPGNSNSAWTLVFASGGCSNVGLTLSGTGPTQCVTGHYSKGAEAFPVSAVVDCGLPGTLNDTIISQWMYGSTCSRYGDPASPKYNTLYLTSGQCTLISDSLMDQPFSYIRTTCESLTRGAKYTTEFFSRGDACQGTPYRVLSGTSGSDCAFKKTSYGVYQVSRVFCADEYLNIEPNAAESSSATSSSIPVLAVAAVVCVLMAAGVLFVLARPRGGAAPHEEIPGAGVYTALAESP